MIMIHKLRKLTYYFSGFLEKLSWEILSPGKKEKLSWEAAMRSFIDIVQLESRQKSWEL